MLALAVSLLALVLVLSPRRGVVILGIVLALISYFLR